MLGTPKLSQSDKYKKDSLRLGPLVVVFGSFLSLREKYY
jgi:hypothetical protein